MYSKSLKSAIVSVDSISETSGGINVDSVLAINGGTVGLDASAGLRFKSDSTSGIIQPSSNQIGIVCGGTTQITQSNGGLSLASTIGTTSINSSLDSAGVSSGALVVKGGLGLGSLRVGGTMFLNSSSQTVFSATSDGSVSAPAFSFASETSTGFYRSAANTIAFAVQSSTPLVVADSMGSFACNTVFNSTSSTAVQVLGGLGVAKNVRIAGALQLPTWSQGGSILAPNGSVNAPTYAFQSSSSSGVYWDPTDGLCFSDSGTRCANFKYYTANSVSIGNPYAAVGIQLGQIGAGNYASNCVAIGHGAQAINYDDNIAIGKNAVASSNQCIAIGNGAVASGSKTIALGTNVTASAHYSMCLGYNLTNNETGVIKFGHDSNTWTKANYNSAIWSSSSDERLKTDIADQLLGLDFLRQIPPIAFKWKPKEDSGGIPDTKRHQGFSYQRIRAALDALGIGDSDLCSMTMGYGNVAKEAFIPILVKSICELDERIAARERALGL